MCVCVLLGIPMLVFGASLPLPEMTVTKTANAPVIDGVLSPGEWDQASACTGFILVGENTLAHVQSIAYITYDDTYFYVAIKNYREAGLPLLGKRARKPDDAAIVFDPSNEIWFTPPAAQAMTFQSLFNAYPAVFDCKMIPSVGYTAMSWSGKWQIASTESTDNWIVEAKALISAFEVGPIKDGATWRALFTTDTLGLADKFRAWAPGGGFADITRHGFLHFKTNAPAFKLLGIESLCQGKVDFPMQITGPAQGNAAVTVTVRTGDMSAGANDQTYNKTISVANGTATMFNLTGAIATGGFCEITAKTGDMVLYHQVIPFAADGFVRQAPAAIETTPYQTPFGLSSFYAPISKRLLVKIDRLYMPQRADAVTGVAIVKDKDGKVVAQRPIGIFKNDFSEFPINLSNQTIPVQTEADWKQSQATKTTIPAPAEYTLEVTLTTKDGKEIASTNMPLKLMGYQFEWQNNTVGVSDKVIAPWTPMALNKGMLTMWNKTYALNGLGLADKIVNAGQRQLNSMKIIAVLNGKEVEVKASKAQMVKQTEAALDFTGSGQAGDLQLSVKTHTEFDGYVLNTMTIEAKKPLQLDRLSLVITMPKREAPCFVTTAGGWAAVHGFTPDKWDSRETALGSMRYNFVPYLFVTDSDRGFTWFGDNTKGWVLDPAEATQQLAVQGNTVTLRINFITKKGLLAQPTTVTYGWMVTPQKPQPAGWRAYTMDYNKPFSTAHSIFLRDADWAVLWPYYSSPYPWDYEKSRAILHEAGDRYTPFVGNIAHAIARYQDYKGRQFEEIAADWGSVPGNTGDGNVARSKGPNDFQVWHWDQWIKKSGLSGLYFDENYLGEDWNYLTGGAYLLPDGTVEPGYSYIGLRDMDKRLRYVFAANGKPQPNLWLHTTGGHPVFAWMPDIAMEGENVEPTSLETDYLDSLPAGRMRSIGMGRNLGASPFVMCQAQRHMSDASPVLIPQFVGWVLLHDILPEQVQFWGVLAPEMSMWKDDMRFLPYWKSGLGITSMTKDVVVSAHVLPTQAVLWIFNLAHQDQQATIQFDLKKLGFDAKKPLLVYDAESGETYPLRNGQLTLNVPKRFWRAVQLRQPKALKGTQSFIAYFNTDTTADEALGNPLQCGPNAVPKTTAKGKTGNGVALESGLSYAVRHNLSSARGSISAQLYFDAATVNGKFISVDNLTVSLSPNKVTLDGAGKNAVFDMQLPAGAAWHAVAVSWQGKEVKVSMDGKEVGSMQLDAPIAIKPMARGLGIVAANSGINLETITFGPLKGAIMDDLMMSK